MNIEWYIKKVENMSNVSVGGSPAYDFGDVILVKYGGWREEIEKILINNIRDKNEKGVNTPKHLQFKRIKDDKSDVCWVLQEKAKGINCSVFAREKDITKFLEYKKDFASIDIKHYEKFLMDIKELYYLGIELKPKNIFFDKEVGFTIIDFLKSSDKTLDLTSIKDILLLKDSSLCIDYYLWSIDENDKDVFKKYQSLSYAIRLKLFLAMKKVIPHFNKYEKWILRTYSFNELKYFQDNNVLVGNLFLDTEEKEIFAREIASIISDNLKKILDGEVKYWDVCANLIRMALDDLGLNYAWLYHERNKKNIALYKGGTGTYDFYDYASESSHNLYETVIELFNEELKRYYQKDSKKTIQEAYDEMQKYNKR